MKKFEIESVEALEQYLALLPRASVLSNIAFQGINFNQTRELTDQHSFADCLFMGCTLSYGMMERMEKTCVVMPDYKMPFKVYPNSLYSRESLYDVYDLQDPDSFEQCYDTRVYKDYIAAGKEPQCVKEALSRSLHDLSISNAMKEFISEYNERDILAVMGGHSISRNTEEYKKIVYISKVLTEKGKLLVSGGGPGAMEATHVGAFLAGRSPKEVELALSILSKAPSYKDEAWLSSSFEVIRRFPQEKGFNSLGIPTWFYGHEPACPFATHIAKYFDNSIREDMLVSIAKGGIIYTPGSAGTIQEIFQDGAQNHYESLGYASPMVFMGKDFYTNHVPVYSFLKYLLDRGIYHNLILAITDDADEIINYFI